MPLRDPRWRRNELGELVHAVNAHDRVKVHRAAPLELGDLGELHADDFGGSSLREAQLMCEAPAQLDCEAPPELRREELPRDVARVVVTVSAQRVAELRVLRLVAALAPAGPHTDRSGARRRRSAPRQRRAP